MSQVGRGAMWVACAYVVALAAAAACVLVLPVHPLLAAGIADVVATLVVFGFSLALGNTSLYDPYWSVAPPFLGLYWWLSAGRPDDPLAWLALGLTAVWAVRLTWNWAHGWGGLQDEDWRYRDLRAQLGPWYWPVSLLGLHLLPTVLVFVGCVPLFFLLHRESLDVNWVWAGVAAVVGLAAVALEARADFELHRFRAARRTRSEVLASGVWSWCRHPNYLGELGFWVALGLFALAGGVPWTFSAVGVLVMLGLFLAISIPMIERRLAHDKPDYSAYRQRTYSLLPFGSRSAGTLVWDLPLRLWHWCFAGAIAGSLYTGLSGDIGLIEQHQFLGYCLLGLVLFRLGWGLWGGRYARYRYYGISITGIWSHLRGRGVARPHTAPGAAIAVVFVVLVLAQVATGLFATDDIFTEGPLTGYVSSETARTMTWIHHRVFWLVLGAIVVHLAAHGVYAARKDPTPLAMFSGRKRVDVDPTPQRLLPGLVTAIVAGGLVWGLLAVV